MMFFSACPTPSLPRPSYKIQPEDPGCYTSKCPSGCQLVLIAKLNDPLGGLYYGIPALSSYVAVSPKSRLYKSTASTQVNPNGDWSSTYYMFHHSKLAMWVIGKGGDALTNTDSSNIMAQSGQPSLMVVPVDDGVDQSAGLKWGWNGITPICMDDNKCRKPVTRMPETSHSLTQNIYPFSEDRDGTMVTKFTYKGKKFEYSERTDSEGALIYAPLDVPFLSDLPIIGTTDMNKSNAKPRRYRVFSFSETDGFRDIKDFDSSQAVTEQENDGRHLEATAIYGNIGIPSSSGLSNATSWEVRMNIEVTHSTNGTYFMTVGFFPDGGYSGIQQTPDTSPQIPVPSGKSFLFSLWNTDRDNATVDEVNKEANLGGKRGVFHEGFGGEGTGQKTMIDYPWSIGDTSTIVIRGSRPSVESTDWCVTSGLAPPGQDEVFLARLCRKSPKNLLRGKISVFVEDFFAPKCSQLIPGQPMNFKVQRAAIYSNWKVFVDGNKVETSAPRFSVNTHNGYARGLTDAGMLGHNAFYLSTGGWNSENSIP